MWVLRHVFRFRVAVARDNLRRCFPQRSEREIDALLDDYYRQLGQVAAEFLKMPDLSADQLRTHMKMQNVERVTRGDRAPDVRCCCWGRTSATGNGRCRRRCCTWACRSTRPTSRCTRPGFDRELRKLRCRFGARLIAAKKLVREVVRRRAAAARGGAARRPDAGLQRRAPVADLSGARTAFYPGPAEIARMTGYAAFFVADAPRQPRAVSRSICCRSARPASGPIRPCSPRATRRWSRR